MKVSNLRRKIDKLKGSEFYNTYSQRLNELIEWDQRNKQEYSKVISMVIQPHRLDFDHLTVPNLESDFYPCGQSIGDMMDATQTIAAKVEQFNQKFEYLFRRVQDWADELGFPITSVKIYDDHVIINPTAEARLEFVQKQQALQIKVDADKVLFDKALARFETELGGTIKELRTDPVLRVEIESNRRELAQLTTRINEITTTAKFLEAFPSPTVEQLQIFSKRYSQS